MEVETKLARLPRTGGDQVEGPAGTEWSIRSKWGSSEQRLAPGSEQRHPRQLAVIREAPEECLTRRGRRERRRVWRLFRGG